ncbi:MAG: inositol monophosphatase [Candidatus Kerfeldbacteria bacterium]|nr:inositol monophosphatase [Candidatus Kerfeldbacteria bacterium]
MLDRELQTATRAATDAGRLLKRHFLTLHAREIHQRRKHDLVTDYDRRANRLIVRRLSAVFPNHGIVAEEGDNRPTRSGYTWAIDPLDGTINYAAEIPYYAVSIALTVNGVPILGVVYAPDTKETSTAVVGKGARRNRRRIRVSKTTKLRDAFIDLEHTVAYPGPQRTASVTQRCLTAAAHVRRSGSAALDLCYLASGHIDGMVLSGPANAWDLYAGIVIAREAGAMVSDGRGQPFHLRSKHFVATNGAIHRQLLKVIA